MIHSLVEPAAVLSEISLLQRLLLVSVDSLCENPKIRVWCRLWSISGFDEDLFHSRLAHFALNASHTG